MNARIGIMLDSREIEEYPAADEEIAGMWRKATKTLRSAAARELDDDLDSRFTLVYQAALQGSTSVVRAAGYRVRGDDNHRVTFAAVAALGLGDLSDAARELNIIRQNRHAAVYDWEGTMGPREIRGCRKQPSGCFARPTPGCATNPGRSRTVSPLSCSRIERTAIPSQGTKQPCRLLNVSMLVSYPLLSGSRSPNGAFLTKCSGRLEDSLQCDSSTAGTGSPALMSGTHARKAARE